MCDSCNSDEMDDQRVYYGGSIKALGEGRVGGYLVRFSGPSDPDLTGEFFTKDTVFGTNMQPPVLYHHGLDGKLKTRIIGSSQIKMDDVGLWIEAQLDMRDEYEKAVHKLIEAGKLGWSSGAGTYETEAAGKAAWIKTWLIAEASATPRPAEPRNRAIPIKALEPCDLTLDESPPQEVSEGPSLVEDTQEAISTVETEPEIKSIPIPMDPEQKTPAPAEDLLAKLLARLDAQEAEMKALKQDTPDVGHSVKSAPAVIVDTDHWKFDNYSTADLSFVTEFLHNTDKARNPSDALVKALAARMDSKETDVHARQAFKAFSAPRGIKANEIAYSTLASYGDEWIGVGYSSALWESVRSGTDIVSRIPSFEFPAGVESLVIPIESTDPTWYVVAQATDLSANPGGIPTNTVTSSQMGTGKVTATLSKLGARTLYTGELNEDSMLPYVPQLMRQLAVSGAEYLESAVIDGDTEAGASTNINDIAGTPNATDWFMAFNGFRKNALVTNTANSRSGTTLTPEDFLETAKLMGTAGQYAQAGKFSFIVDANTYWTALTLPEVKTRDVFVSPTIENGRLTGLYGFDLSQSFHMHKASTSRKANTAGKIDVDTQGNNTTGSILGVRWDRWQFGFRRRMTMETTRIAAADSTEIVAMMRASLVKRDTDASAITYNVTL